MKADRIRHINSLIPSQTENTVVNIFRFKASQTASQAICQDKSFHKYFFYKSISPNTIVWGRFWGQAYQRIK